MRGTSPPRQSPLCGQRRVGDAVSSEILCGLVLVVVAHAGREQQRQAHRAIIRLVGAIFAVVQHRDTVIARSIGQIEPLVLRDFEFPLVVVAALDAPTWLSYVANGLDTERGNDALRLDSGVCQSTVENDLHGDCRRRPSANFICWTNREPCPSRVTSSADAARAGFNDAHGGRAFDIGARAASGGRPNPCSRPGIAAASHAGTPAARARSALRGCVALSKIEAMSRCR